MEQVAMPRSNHPGRDLDLQDMMAMRGRRQASSFEEALAEMMETCGANVEEVGAEAGIVTLTSPIIYGASCNRVGITSN